MAARNVCSRENVLLRNFKNGDAGLIQFQINDLPDHLVQRQGTDRIVGTLRHQLHPFSELGNA
ncbi:hypothetical protein D3C85_1881030 [compost metagenome]